MTLPATPPSTLVLDASIVLKWLLRDPEREQDTAVASRLMEATVSGRLPVLQPFHWLAEIAAVLSRLSPATAADDVVRLQALELPATDHPAVLRRACELAIRHRAHVFDTLYHAVALEEPEAVLVTADAGYWRAARGEGKVVRLEEWVESS